MRRTLNHLHEFGEVMSETLVRQLIVDAHALQDLL
jgi:hypothetical protein